MNRITYENVDSAVDFLLSNPTVSGWLKDRIREIDKRDIVDATHDVAVLSAIVRAKCERALGGAR